jgi:hypothetical protein
MKTHLLFLAFLCVSRVFAQDITGLWLRGSLAFGSSYPDRYTFLKDGQFVFEPDESDEFRLAKKIVGRYTIYNDTLHLSTDSLIYLIPNSLNRYPFLQKSASWSVSGKKLISVPIHTNVDVEFSILKPRHIVTIDRDTYYRLPLGE